MKKTHLFFVLLFTAPLLIAGHTTSNAWQQESIASTAAASAAAGTQEAITITVTNGTSFTATPNLWLKQSDVQVVGTLDQALAQLPKFGLNHAVTINMGAGTDASATVSGFSGSGSITITGTLAVTTFDGDDTGTCDTATTTTCTPTAPGWTASEALGSLIEFTNVDGSNELTYRSPTIQTTGVITVLAVSSLNNGDTYRIVAPSSIVTALTVKQNSIPITFNYMKVAGLTQQDNRNVTFNACQFSAAATTSTNNWLETYSNTVFTASSAPTWNDTAKIVFTNTVLKTSNATITGARRVTGDVVALATTTSSALTLNQVDNVAIGFDAKNCTYTPLTTNDVAMYVLSGIGLTGTNNTGATGAAFNGITNVKLAGTTPTLVGTAQVSVNAASTTWATVVAYTGFRFGSAWFHGAAASTTFGIGGPATIGGTLVASGATTLSSTLQVNGAAAFSGQLGANGYLTTPIGTTSGAGTVIGDATAASTKSYVVITSGAASSGILTQAPNATTSLAQVISNQTGNTILVYPATGSVQINALGVGNPYSLTNGSAIMVWGTSTTQEWAVPLN